MIDLLCLIASLPFPEVGDFNVKEKAEEVFEKEAKKPDTEKRTQTFWWFPLEGLQHRQGTKRWDVVGGIICGLKSPTFPLCDQMGARSFFYPRADVRERTSVEPMYGYAKGRPAGANMGTRHCKWILGAVMGTWIGRAPPVSTPSGVDLPSHREGPCSGRIWQHNR